MRKAYTILLFVFAGMWLHRGLTVLGWIAKSSLEWWACFFIAAILLMFGFFQLNTSHDD
jgi:hypothetical protein